MGSFNATCIVSNLQIEAGTPVRFLALTRSAYQTAGNEHICYVAGRWQLRCPPIQAEYNDYGSIENLEPRLANRVFFESLSRGVVEKGVGDNQCHDVQVRRGMSEDQWLEALWEGRVEVRDYEDSSFTRDWRTPEPPKGIPTLSRIEALCQSHRWKVVTDYGATGYVLDEVSPGFVRIRLGQHAAPAKEHRQLVRLVPVLHQAGFAAMIMCGTGSSPRHAEVLVAPKPVRPGQRHFTNGVAPKDDDYLTRIRPVSQAMVREDVWQILLKTPLDDWRGGKLTFAKMREAGEQVLKKELEAQQKADPLMRLSLQADHENLLRHTLYPNEGMGGFGLRESLAFALDLDPKPSPKELDGFLTDLTETAYVQWVYAGLHGQWQPTTNSGQDGRWKEHRVFLKALAKIKGRWEDEE